jgi:hypothetical protein
MGMRGGGGGTVLPPSTHTNTYTDAANHVQKILNIKTLNNKTHVQKITYVPVFYMALGLISKSRAIETTGTS